VSTLRVLVVDDEPLARAMVAALAREDRDVSVVEECGDASAVAAVADRVRPDIVFLDVQMPEIDGIQVAERLSGHGPVVVFVTAYSTYAVEAFEVGAIDYLLKPFSDERFREALGRAKRRVHERRLAADAPGLRSTTSENSRLEFGDVAVSADDIIWIEAQDYYVRIHTAASRHLVRVTLASLEERLDAATFLRVHRNAIVNRHQVRERLEADGSLRLLLSNGSAVPVSRARRKAVEARL
jgi:two-component system LytT family response regulator